MQTHSLPKLASVHMTPSWLEFGIYVSKEIPTQSIVFALLVGQTDLILMNKDFCPRQRDWNLRAVSSEWTGFTEECKTQQTDGEDTDSSNLKDVSTRESLEGDASGPWYHPDSAQIIPM